MKAFCTEIIDTPVVWCGDFNSQPQGFVHQYLTRGVVNAKAAAPWYSLSHKQGDQQKSDHKIDSNETSHEEITDQFDRLHMTKQSSLNNEMDNGSEPKVKYLLDYTLNRFCRWLRILGVDAALETEKEEKERTKDANM